jgi:hypothetical protein
VGFLPGLNDTELLPSPEKLDKEKGVTLLDSAGIDPDSKEKMVNIMKGYPALVKNLKNKALELGEWWNIGLWQLYLHLALTGQQAAIIPEAFNQKPITRIVSQNDSSYLDLMTHIMNVCNIAVTTISDIQGLTTIELLKENTPKELLAEKYEMKED